MTYPLRQGRAFPARTGKAGGRYAPAIIGQFMMMLNKGDWDMIVRALEMAVKMLEDSAVKSEPDAAELRAPVMRALAGYIRREGARSRHMRAAEYVPHKSKERA